MVYYGKLSKGCERCRLRKVRCDQRRPGCTRCEKSSAACPGYRDLGQVLFRDESARVIERARRDYHVGGDDASDACAEGSPSPHAPAAQGADPAWSLELPLARSLQLPVGRMAADFFFSNFVVEGPLLSDTNCDLLMSTYDNHPESAAFHAIEAIGLAGLSNVFRVPQLCVEARKRYGQALVGTNSSLSDPAEATSDVTAMSVLLLAQFESMTVESWDQYSRAHLEGASALLKLRGQKQFERESGVRTYFALRMQILTDCMLQELPVPESLLEAGRALQKSPINRPRSSRAPIGDVYIRYLDLIAAMRSAWPLGQVNMQWLLMEIDDLDRALQAWRQGIHPDYEYTTVHVTPEITGSMCNLPSVDAIKGTRHIYKNKWSPHIWNKWRIMRLLLYRLKLDYGISDTRQYCETIIRDTSSDICLSVPCLLASSRATTLIWPLYAVSQEVLNDHCIRTWAVQQLRHISDSIGIRQAALVADLVQAALRDTSSLNCNGVTGWAFFKTRIA